MVKEVVLGFLVMLVFLVQEAKNWEKILLRFPVIAIVYRLVVEAPYLQFRLLEWVEYPGIVGCRQVVFLEAISRS